MSTDRERLVHDVGKYVARTAINLPPGRPIAPALAQLLLRDVYGRDDEPRMSAVFDALVGETTDVALVACRAELRAIDALEEPSRRGDEAALAEVAEHARAVAERIRAWARGEGAS